MHPFTQQFGFLKALTWTHLAMVAAILIGCGLLVKLVRVAARRVAERSPPRQRLLVLRITPIARLVIGAAGLVMIVPLLVEPNFEDVVALLAATGLALAFALKDWVSCLMAGLVTVLENTYQPGDWIKLDGVEGEVRIIGARAVRVVTADDTEVIIPHAKIWSESVFNESSGKPSLLCVVHIYLDPDHDGEVVRGLLTQTAEASPFREPDSPVVVGVTEAPFATHYRLKVYVHESRQRFAMVTDLTLQAKAKLREAKIAFATAPPAIARWNG